MAGGVRSLSFENEKLKLQHGLSEKKIVALNDLVETYRQLKAKQDEALSQCLGGRQELEQQLGQMRQELEQALELLRSQQTTPDLPDASGLLNALKTQKPKTKASLSDVEAILELINPS